MACCVFRLLRRPLEEVAIGGLHDYNDIIDMHFSCSAIDWADEGSPTTAGRRTMIFGQPRKKVSHKSASRRMLHVGLDEAQPNLLGLPNVAPW